MAKAQEVKGELSPATATIVVVVAVLVIGFLGWLFFFRETAPPPMPGTPTGASMPGSNIPPPPPGAPGAVPAPPAAAPAPPAATTR